MNSAVNSPSHYRRGGFELAQVIDAFELDRWETQAAQYLFRAKHKDGGAHEAQDLAKTIAFLIHALTLKSPETLERFEAFGFQLTRGVKSDGASIDRPSHEPGPAITLAEALKRVPAEDFDGDATTAVMNARRGQLWLGSSGAALDIVLADLDPDAPIVAALRKAADRIHAGAAA
ncbi:DUF3310 domain-containing protein [Chenggangzhangella methanolivorans]|uniref:DUF3310 domain-containing protein n=1 Tax=Chenggangzhangella methanolivorans TaxID=1437009 RepID=A0A9E6UM73_9HYPH|nr:DUF3310 domain-containing protein [Chenggangzhangella methanolivorans]QZN99760.1 DUF3310 domain-containing protein [Chenggangzhangella methanolivorans]